MDTEDLNSLTKGDLLRLGLKITGQTIVSRGRNFIYLPRRYDSNPEYEEWKSSVEEISYQVEGLRMSAFLDCDPDRKPERIWLMFGGNASLALDWLPLTTFAPPSPDAFVLFDYPGFGASEGNPSRKLINHCVDELIEKLMIRFSLNRSAVGSRFLVMGHSLGAAISLETAVRHSIRKGILVAPFTSVRKIGQMMFGKLLPYLATDQFDNLAAIRKITASVENPRFHIIHGTRDDIIPISMAREMHRAHPGHTNLWEIPDANHNDILLLLSKELGLALTNGGDFNFELVADPGNAPGTPGI